MTRLWAVPDPDPDSDLSGGPAPTAVTRISSVRATTSGPPTAGTAIRVSAAGPKTAGTAIRVVDRLTAAGKRAAAEILNATAKSDRAQSETAEANSGGARVGGERFGPYELEQLLGRGGMGEVWRAYDHLRGRAVALKRLHPHLADSPQFQLRFRREAALAARLNDPHVIPIHDYGEVDGRLYIDMRLVEGVGLNTLLSTFGPLDPVRAVDIVSQTGGALTAAHDEGLVHRDVKPSNVLLTDKGSDGREARDFVYLVDFGIAHTKEATSMTSTGFTVGTLAYMAPERFDGMGDHRVDVYALGCLLYEALTASRPFPVEGLPGLLKAHLNTPPPRPSALRPGIPAALDEVVTKAMAKAPCDRYQSATALAVAARAALAPARRPVVAAAPHLKPVAPRPTLVAPRVKPATRAKPAAPATRPKPAVAAAHPNPVVPAKPAAPPTHPKPAAPAARRNPPAARPMPPAPVAKPRPAARPKPAVAAPRARPAALPPRRKGIVRRTIDGLFLTLFTLVAGLIIIAILLYSHLPDLLGFDVHPGHYLPRHIVRG